MNRVITTTAAAAAATLALATACVDTTAQRPTPPDAGTADAGDATGDASSDAGADSGTGTPEPVMATCLLVHGSDWMSGGSLSVVDLDTGEQREDLTSYHQDARIRVIGESVYVLNRMYGDSVMELDPGSEHAVLWEASVRTSDRPLPNPHDLVRHDDRLYIALYNDGVIAQAYLRPQPDGRFLTGSSVALPTPAWDGSVAEVTALRVVGDTLFALTQGLDDSFRCSSAEARGRVHAYALPSLEPAPIFSGAAHLDLATCNPGGWIALDADRVLIHSLGNYRIYTSNPTDDGALEIVNLTEGTSEGIVANETAAGNRDIFKVVRSEDGALFATTVADDFDDGLMLVRLTPTASGMWEFGPPLYEGNVWDALPHGGRLYVAERSVSRAALYTIDGQTGAEVVAPWSTGLPPEQLVLFRRDGACW